MTTSFSDYLASLRPESEDAVELQVAAMSVDLLLAFADIRGLELSLEEAQSIVQAASGPLSDDQLNSVSGGETTVTGLLGAIIRVQHQPH